MSVRKNDKKVPSSDGIHTLSGVVYIPDGAIKGIVQVVHGMKEYIGRYDNFMTELAENGYIVFGHDHLGHGRTAGKDELGFIAHKDGWKHLVDDVGVFGSEVKKELEPLIAERNGDKKKVPYILFGHSMGSFVVRLAAERFDRYDKLIVMGTGGPNPATGAGIAFLKMDVALKGERHFSKTANKLVFGSYNDRFKGEDGTAWLSVNRQNVEKYDNDPSCRYNFSASAMLDLLHLVKESNSGRWFSSVNKTMPILLTAGGEDPVGSYGEGVRTVYDRLAKNGANVTIKLYDGYRHEILNDYCSEQVIKDILEFIA